VLDGVFDSILCSMYLHLCVSIFASDALASAMHTSICWYMKDYTFAVSFVDFWLPWDKLGLMSLLG